eukprot:Hpha_TRINITY_DN11841_c0_g1::TRINITY_DN11841_c0_g1_i1::g.2060::m.2060
MDAVPAALRDLLLASSWRRLRRRAPGRISRELTGDGSGTASSIFSAVDLGVAPPAGEDAGDDTLYYYKFVYDAGSYACLLMSGAFDGAWMEFKLREAVAASAEAELPQFRISAERVCRLVAEALRSPEENQAAVSVTEGDRIGSRLVHLSCPLALPGVAPVCLGWKLDLTDVNEYGDGKGSLKLLRQQVVEPLAAAAHGAAWVAQLLQQWAVAQGRELRMYKERFGALPVPGSRGGDFDPARFRDDIARSAEVRSILSAATIDTSEPSGWLEAILLCHRGGPPPAPALPAMPVSASVGASAAAAASPPAVDAAGDPSPKRARIDDEAPVRVGSYVVSAAEKARRDALSQRLVAPPDPSTVREKKIKRAFR